MRITQVRKREHGRKVGLVRSSTVELKLHRQSSFNLTNTESQLLLIFVALVAEVDQPKEKHLNLHGIIASLQDLHPKVAAHSQCLDHSSTVSSYLNPFGVSGVCRAKTKRANLQKYPNDL